MSDFQEQQIVLADGYAAYARYWPAAGREPAAEPGGTVEPAGAERQARGAVLYLHGIQSHCGWYEQTARALAEAGLAVLQPDRRGSGRNARDRGHADSPQQLLDDAFAAARLLRELSGALCLHVLGVSWGGKLAVAMHVTDPSVAASLTLVAPGVFPVIDVSPAEKLRIGWSMVSQPRRLFPIPLNDPELFTRRPEYVRFLQEDAYRLHEATAGFFVASRRLDRVARGLERSRPVPLHVFLAGDERIIDNGRTQTWAEELGWPQRGVTVYPRSRHTLEFGDDGPEYVADLVGWLRGVDAAEATSGKGPDRGSRELAPRRHGDHGEEVL